MTDAPKPTCNNLALVLKAMADPLRIQVLKVLGESSFGVLELSQIFTMKQSGMSHHLKTLATANLVTTQREGNSIFYRRSLEDAFDVQQTIFSAIDDTVFDEQVLTNLNVIENERELNSQAFFAKHATQFKQQQDLIAQYASYQSLCEEMMLSLNAPHDHAIEIGPGQGEFLLALAKQYKKVLALDVSKALLDIAQNTCKQANLNNIEFKLDDLQNLSKPNADLIVLNMVLHHITRPQAFILQASRLLKQTGHLMITDLCQHDQQWAKESCADLWLGFSQLQLENWAQKARLNLTKTSFVAMRNGFQVQCLLFSKTNI
ncbi:ArsR/SmtB family transcription factor [Marinicellulosiphila megalodicopiae]|uniref:ArsR/SmtB family transcription factor n=1 Tax=Marinicellulosiphila megalodicopiae TaxID=2724896 RepID=UPI003BB03C9E